MSFIRRFAAASAAAAFLTVGFASTASAELLPLQGLTGAQNAQPISAPGSMSWYAYTQDGSLVDLSENNVGPFQACNNDGLGNVIGGTVKGNGVIGILGSDGNSVTDVHNCDQSNAQLNGENTSAPAFFKVDDSGSLVKVTDNNVGPFQACNNELGINGIGGLVPINGVVGILSDDNSAEIVRNCGQDSVQDN